MDELYEAGNDPTFIANAFVQNDAGFRIYTEYCTDYPQIMATLTDLTKNEMTAKLIRERQIALGHALPLGSYLLKPVQRILKYHLLLQVRTLKLVIHITSELSLFFIFYYYFFLASIKTVWCDSFPVD